jgi:hypothetical protein
MTRDEFGRAVQALLTEEQRRQIRDLHDRVAEAWSDAYAAHHEGADCCVDALVGEPRAEIRVGYHVEDCRCLVRDGAVLNVDLRCEIL